MKFTLSKKSTFHFYRPSQGSVLNVMRRLSTYAIWLLFLGVLSWLGYIWYASVSVYQWTEEQKSQYRNEYAGQTSFREDRFSHTVSVLQERIRLHGTRPTVVKNIFIGDSISKEEE